MPHERAPRGRRSLARLRSVRISLFWRTFLLIGGLIVMSIAAALQMRHAFDRAPPEQQIAWEIASVVNLTRSALVSSEGDRRRQLLDDLARYETVRVALLEPGDVVEPLPAPRDTARLEQHLQAMLGKGTRVAGSVNGERGLWVSFFIDDDGFWLAMSLDRWTRRFGPPLWQVASLAVSFSMLGALAISQLVNRPLASLARAIGEISRGAAAGKLPEDGPSEIAALNRRFNRMASELAALEADRALALAGISHDVRTPLTRLRMEVELSALGDDEKASMSADIERIDEIVGKFVEYARSAAGGVREGARIAEVDVALTIAAVVDAVRSRSDATGVEVDVELAPNLRWRGDAIDLSRILENLLENALRYGHDGTHPPRIAVRAWRDDAQLTLQVDDAGPGVPEGELERLLRPFARLDAERSESGGSGLGLAIVQRLAQRHGGRCSLSNRETGGLSVSVTLRDAA